MPPTRTSLVAVLLLALAGAGVAAVQSPAQAAVITTTNITAPADGTHFTVTTFSAIPKTTVTGTSDGTTGDHVDIRCYEVATSHWQPGPTDVPLAADGSFSVQMSIDVPYGTCQLVAVPSGWAKGSSLAGFFGPRVTAEYKRTQKYASGPSTGKAFDLSLAYQGAHAIFDITSATDSGYDESRLNYPEGSSSDYFWDSNGGSLRAGTGEARSRIRVDGRDAYGPYSASSQNLGSDIPGRPGLTWGVTRDGATGVTRVTEHNPLVACPKGSPYPATAPTCASFSSVGVALDRSYVITDGGRQVHLTDVWRSVDGRSHSISAQYVHSLFGFDYVANANTAVSLKLPWISPSFQTFSGEASFAESATLPNSILVRDDDTASDPSTLLPRGALTFDFPAQMHRTTATLFRLDANTFTVPANSSRTLRESFVIANSEADMVAKAKANETRINPYRPDAQIKLSGSPFSGNNVYNSTGSHQYASAATKRAHAVTFLIAVQNDGTRTESFRIKGTTHIDGFDTRYMTGLTGGSGITTAVREGTFGLQNVAPGAKKYFRLIVYVHPGTSIHKLAKWLITATSVKDPTRTDTVKADVVVVR